MQPTLPQSTGAADMDLPAVQPMDWLFKKERVYLLAQFWQQRATLAEKEVNSLKEQLSSTNISSQNNSATRTNPTSMQNGCLAPSSLASPTMSECSSSGNHLSSKSLNNNKLDELDENKMDTNEQTERQTVSHSGRSTPLSNIDNNKNDEDDDDDVDDDDDDDDDDVIPVTSTISSTTSNSLIGSTTISTAASNTLTASKRTTSAADDNEGKSSNTCDDISAKDKEIVALVEEISRLRSALAALQESHNLRIQHLEERLEAKRQHISLLESRLAKQSDYDDVKKENRSADLSSDSKELHFQEMLLERTKALAAQAEALKLNSDDDHGNRHQDDKSSSHHDASSTASTPILQDARFDNDNNNQNGGALTPRSMPISKSPQEDNNNHLGALPHGATNFSLGLPFHHQIQERYRFADELSMGPGSMAGRLGDSLIPKGDPMEARLQEMLRYNMDKYANQNLDTLHISRRVRELLSVHNVGQRLFAKYVLGLSQGTVSELLSKPKPWDKLTEKGRDSYRKMHAWACDDNAVLLLKSLIPKKDSGLPPFGRGDDSGMGDDRIAHILSEASGMLKPQQMSMSHPPNDDSRSNDDMDSSHDQSSSPFPKERRMRNDDVMSREKMARIYQEELAKLMSRDAFPNSLFPQFMPPATSTATSQMPEDNIRMALEAYYRELAKLQQTGGNVPNFPNLPGLLALQQQALNGAQDLTLKKEQQAQSQATNQSQAMKMNGQHTSIGNDETNKENDDVRLSSGSFSMVRPKPEPGTTPTTTASSTAPSPLGNSILPPAMTPNDDFSSAASPLQRMASITNSLITQAPMPNHHSSQQRPLKAVLPPITQQQFDTFNSLNTEDIVRRIKEALSQYSISQRLFGESVLGLSQGSVSDLLARPKPWHMLTQKGREPFIRMKMFLEDDNAVHKLVASQYKIAPEKLMRTGSYSGTPQIPSGIAKQLPPMQKMISEMSKMQEQQQQHLLHLQQLQMGSPLQPPPSQLHNTSNQSQNAVLPSPAMLLTPPGVPPHHRVTIPLEDKNKMSVPVHSPQQTNAMRSLHQHMSPTVYEMAALTQDLDTQVITTKIKEALMANNIGQKIFGEAVLGLSQGSVSELLSKPKPWHMLSIKGREPFIRMQLWLSDANNVDRLQALKNERREASKRRRSTGAGMQDNSSDTSSNDTSEFYASNSPGPGSVGSAGAPPNKKQRVLFTEEQKEALRLAFALDPYPNVATIEFLANELGLSTRTITNWFHNHRMRLKQQVPHGTPTDQIPSRENQSGAPFDPVQFRVLLSQRLVDLQKERIGLPLQYAPYFAANQNLAALLSRGLLPTNEAELAALNAFKESISGLDLSMGAGLKQERDDYSDDENDMENNDSDGGGGGGDGGGGVDDDDDDDDDNTGDNKSESYKDSSPLAMPSSGRSSRRKPAAPQWLNPNANNTLNATAAKAADDEVIINGVCVMNTDYSRDGDDKSPHQVEPNARLNDNAQLSDNDDDDDDDDGNDGCDRLSVDCEERNAKDIEKSTNKDGTNNDKNASTPIVKKEIKDTDRWEY